MVEEAAGATQSEPKSSEILDKSVAFGGRTYTMHPRHWYEDGSFGFLLESTAFLLHRSLLARKSSVMADMFGLPQRASSPPEASSHPLETINGVPFIVLQDKANDFANVLDIIYTDITMDDERSDLDAAALMGIVRFANKYLLDKVKEWGVSQILSSQSLLVVEDDELSDSLEDEYSEPEFCVQVIQFARECSLPRFLPLAFYALAMTDWSQKSSEDFFVLNKLSPDDLWRIQDGKLKLTKALLKQAYNMPDNGCTGERCQEPSCYRALRPVWTDPTERWMELQLHPLEELELRLRQKYDCLCAVCRRNLRSRTETLLHDLITSLPGFFRID
ncbi:hypothetical protein FRC00_003828 [Tulasnella sp. 408]|nr:hypothetical protein FRC00_003828 [Tulasnella sp. 408]